MTSSHSIRGVDSLDRCEDDEREHVHAERDRRSPTDADSGIRIGSNASRRSVAPPSTIDGSIGRHRVDEEEEEEDPDQEEQREVLGLVRGPQEVREHEPEHAEVREWLDERPDVPERGIGVPGLEVDDAHDAQHAEVVRDATRGSGPCRPMRALTHVSTTG